MPNYYASDMLIMLRMHQNSYSARTLLGELMHSWSEGRIFSPVDGARSQWYDCLPTVWVMGFI